LLWTALLFLFRSFRKIISGENHVSHLVRIATQIRDPLAVASACQRLHLPAPVPGTTKLYNDTATGLAVQLPGWRYPAVCDLARGEIKFDNFNGHWGAPQELDKFLQAYAVEKALIEARKQGHTVTEQPLTDGSIRLTIQVAGGAA
jgi:hypothetical protein